MAKEKKSVSFVVVGHVDAGKSTLMGRLLLELKYVDKHTVERYRRQAEKIGKQSFELAWVMDQTQEERDRGVTIDVATNHFETDKTKFTILDAPGHRDFIPNMIAGASQADFAILVVDAEQSAFEKGLKGQTYEHVLLLRSIGIHRIIVAVNKMDIVRWSQARFDEITQQVTGFLKGKRFIQKNISFVPISGFDGTNVARPPEREKKEAAWYRGPTLLEQLDSLEPAARSLTGPFRMAISEIWKSHLGKTTMSGRVARGTVQVGDAILMQPSGEAGYVKSLMADNDLREWAVAGENVSITVVGIDLDNVKSGDYACSAQNPLQCSTSFSLKAMAFDYLMPMTLDVHRGRLHSAGQVTELTALLDLATGESLKSRPKVVKPGEVARIRINLTQKIPLEGGQRVVIRNDGETIAAGVVE
jgi:elongation factor 1 alpha-like protein